MAELIIEDNGPGMDEDCCTSLTVPDGTYYRSYDGIDDTSTADPATVSAFSSAGLPPPPQHMPKSHQG